MLTTSLSIGLIASVNRASFCRILRIFFYVTFSCCCRATCVSSIFKLLLPAPKFSYPLANRPVRHLGLPIDITYLTVNVYRFYTCCFLIVLPAFHRHPATGAYETPMDRFYTELRPTFYIGPNFKHVASSFPSHFVYSVMNTL